MLGVEDVEIQLWCTGILRPVQLVAGDEGVVELVAGGHEDQVVLGLFTTGKGHALPAHRGDIAARADVAMADMVQHQRVHHRMRLVQAVVRVGQTVLRGFADQCAHQQTVDQLFETARQLDRTAEGVGGFAEDELGQEVIATAHRKVDRGSAMHGIDGDIAGRVAAADHQHPFAGEDIRALVGI